MDLVSVVGLCVVAVAALSALEAWGPATRLVWSYPFVRHAAQAALAAIAVLMAFDLVGTWVIVTAVLMGIAAATWLHLGDGVAGRAVRLAAGLGAAGAMVLALSAGSDSGERRPGMVDPPIAVAIGTARRGRAPLHVVFDASKSRHARGAGPLKVEWDLDGDGDHDDATTVRVARTYVVPGRHVVRLRVSDRNGSASTDTLTLTVQRSPGASR